MTEFSEARAKRILLISLVLVGMGFTVLFPILAPVGREMGLTLQITAIIGASSITVFLASPRWGRLSDRLGRKAVILIGLFGFALGTFLFNGVIYLGLSAAITGTTLFAALVRMVHAAVMSATMPAANAFMADITSPETVPGRARRAPRTTSAPCWGLRWRPWRSSPPHASVGNGGPGLWNGLSSGGFFPSRRATMPHALAPRCATAIRAFSPSLS